MKDRVIQVRISSVQEDTILKAGKILEKEAGESLNKSEIMRRLAFGAAKQLIKASEKKNGK